MGRVTVFCGKGGVGKTTLSLAYALYHAGRGRRVVVVTSHPLSELAVSVSLHGLKEQHPAAAARMFIIHIDPREILNNKVRQQIPSDLLARTVLSSRIYQNLVEVAPGLKELAFMARLKQLAEERTQEGGSFDLLVWDSPATGHFLQTLKVSRNFDTYLSGPFSMAGKDLAEFYAKPGNVTLFPVTTLEEMAVEETIELWQKLSAELAMQPAAVVCNLASPVLSASDREFDEIQESFGRASDSEHLHYIVERHAAERDLFQKLERSVEGPFRFVKRTSHPGSDLDLLASVSQQLGPALAVNA